MTSISPELPFKSNYLNILEGVIHYIDVPSHQKSDKVFLYIHGNPTSCYLWRNIISYTLPFGRSVAFDLIGFGKSSKPEIDYTYTDHIQYVNTFINKLNLKNIILVLHDWGGAIGFNYAACNPENIKGIVFMETFCKPMEWENFDFLTRFIFRNFRNPASGQKWNGKYNAFLRFILPMSINRKLSSIEKKHYESPFQTVESRKPIVKFPQELPFKNEGTLNERIVSKYYTWLRNSSIPKLLIYASPGVQIKFADVEQHKSEFPNLTTAFIGKGKHYIQEDQPQNIGEAIEHWYLLKWKIK